jgi:aminomethyltransferase
LRLVDVEGLQRCELVTADAAGVIDPAILGARGNSDASGLKQILSGTSESAHAVRAGLERRGIDLAKARAITLFGGRPRRRQANSPCRAMDC